VIVPPTSNALGLVQEVVPVSDEVRAKIAALEIEAAE
jgi:hypothetical protein